MSENCTDSGKKLRAKIRKLFDTAREQAGHHNVVESAKKLYNTQNDCEMFLKEFVDALKCCLVHPDKLAVDRILLFVSKFSAALYSHKALIQDVEDSEEDMEHPFVNGLMTFIFETHSAISVDARLRCTTLINYILSAMPDESWLPVSIWNGLAEMTRTRLQDRNAAVRVAAVLVARKLQEPKDPKCAIIKLLLFHMIDPAPAVRRAVVSSIALSKLTINDVLGRTLDVNDNVRRNAYVVLAKVRFQSLTITQRITLLQRGLRDRVDRVRNCVETVLITQWVDQVNKNVLTLLEGLDVVNCPEIVELALKSIIKIVPMESLIEFLHLDGITNLIPIEQLTPETALLWKFLIRHASEEKMSDALDNLLPNITAFCDFLKQWYPLEESESEKSEDPWQEVKQKYVLIHLIELALYFDLTDEMGRQNLRKQITTMLINPNIKNQTIDKLVELLYVVIPDLKDFLMTLTEIISDIREPMTQIVVKQSKEEQMQKQVALSTCKLTLNDLQEKEYEAVNSRNYAEAAKLNTEIEELNQKIASLSDETPVVLSEVRDEKTDPETLCKCLKIVVKMIPTSKIKSLTPGLKCMLEDFLVPCMASEDLLTQSLAIQALAQFCILDKTLAQDHVLSFLLMLSENGEDEINVPALKAVFDILLVNGTQCFNQYSKPEDLHSSQIGATELSVPAEKCIAALKELLNSTSNDEMKLIAFEGFCKLLLNGVIYSPSLLKSIIIKGFSPIRGNEAEDRIRQLFMVFFPMFARNSTKGQEMIEAAFLPILRSLNDANPGTPEADINPRDVIVFLIDHTRPGINPFTCSTVHVHNNFALAICHEILREADLYEEIGIDQNYLKALQILQLSFDEESYNQQLRVLFTKIEKKTRDAACIKIIKQFWEKISQVRSVSSIQNTLENSSDITEGSRSTITTKKMILDSVPESIEDLSISHERFPLPEMTRMVIAESPDVSEESDSN